MHTVIHGLDIDVSTYNIHIELSYLIETRSEMKSILVDLKNQLDRASITMETPYDHRSIESMVNEWVAHNNCYKLGLWKDRVISVDLNYPQPWYMPFIYWLTSRIVL